MPFAPAETPFDSSGMEIPDGVRNKDVCVADDMLPGCYSASGLSRMKCNKIAMGPC